MIDQTIPHLLQQVTTITKKYDELATITGERYNVFGILGISTDEVRMHSAFIANLLDSNGSHGCGSILLKLFIAQQSTKCIETDFIKRLEEFESESSKTKTEHHIGFINEDATEGGRIDILITDSNGKHIIIENKIYAGDQQLQLVRYNKCPNFLFDT
jgi:hypothetical protein